MGNGEPGLVDARRSVHQQIEIYASRTPAFGRSDAAQTRFGRLQRREQFPGREPRQEPRRRVDEIRLRDRTKGFRTVSLRSQHKAGIRHLRERLVCARNLHRRLIEIAAESDVRR